MNTAQLYLYKYETLNVMKQEMSWGCSWAKVCIVHVFIHICRFKCMTSEN